MGSPSGCRHLRLTPAGGGEGGGPRAPKTLAGSRILGPGPVAGAWGPEARPSPRSWPPQHLQFSPAPSSKPRCPALPRVLAALKGAHGAAVPGRGPGRRAGRAAAGTGRLSRPQETLVLNLMATGRGSRPDFFVPRSPRPAWRVDRRGQGGRAEQGDQLEATAGRRWGWLGWGGGGSRGGEKLTDLGNGLTWSREDGLTAWTGGRQGRQESRPAPGVDGAPAPGAGEAGGGAGRPAWQRRAGRGSWFRARAAFPAGEGRRKWGRGGRGGGGWRRAGRSQGHRTASADTVPGTGLRLHPCEFSRRDRLTLSHPPFFFGAATAPRNYRTRRPPPSPAAGSGREDGLVRWGPTGAEDRACPHQGPARRMKSVNGFLAGYYRYSLSDPGQGDSMPVPLARPLNGVSQGLRGWLDTKPVTSSWGRGLRITGSDYGDAQVSATRVLVPSQQQNGGLVVSHVWDAPPEKDRAEA